MFDRIKKRAVKTQPIEPDPDGLDAHRRAFVDAVWAMTEPHGIRDLYPLDELCQVSPPEYQVFLNNLKSEINDPLGLRILKNQLAEKTEHARVQALEVEQKKAREHEEAIERKRAESVRLAEQQAKQAQERREEQQLELDQIELPPVSKAKEAASKPPKPTRVDKSLDAMRMTPVERVERSESNLDTVLDWLRQEPYSTAENVALMMGMGTSGARKMLNKFVRDGYLVRDEIEKWPGVAKKLHLFGVSQHGLNAQKMISDDAPVYDRVFRRGKTSPNKNGPHTLRLQLARIYLQKIDNPTNVLRPYTLDRDLPHFGDKYYQWRKYPDGVIENSHLEFQDKPGQKLTIGIELERNGKGQERYREVLDNHMSNINEPSAEHNLSDRYDVVYYFLKTRRIANNMRIAFDKYIDDREYPASTKKRFIFDTYSDLKERINALNDA